MKRYSGCTAFVTDDKVILSQPDASWSKVKHYNRVCKYALERGKPCENNCRIRDDELSWEASHKQFEEMYQKALNRIELEL